MGVVGSHRGCVWFVTTPVIFLSPGIDILLPAAFFSALIVGVSLHYHKIVENEYYGYPEEWFPSVSATIGDRYPERSFFMVFIAITSGMSAKTILWSNCLLFHRASICFGHIMVPPYSPAESDIT